MNIHDSSNLQQQYGSQGIVDYMSIYEGQIEQLRQEIEELKKSKSINPQLSIQNEVDETNQSNLYRISKSDTAHNRNDIRRHTGRVQTTNEIKKQNPFSSTRISKRDPFSGFNIKYGRNT